MSQHEFTIPGGESWRFRVGGKYSEKHIVVHAQGTVLPELSSPGRAEDLMEGKELLDGLGKIVAGTFTLAPELGEQGSLIRQIQAALVGKAAPEGGDLPAGYRRCGYIRFTGEQIVDTDHIPTQDTKIKILFTREDSTTMYLYGVSSDGNTASVTAYLSSGGAWRFGNKSVSRTIRVSEDVIHTAVVDSSGIESADGKNAYSSVTDFEAVGSLLLGAVRNASGTVAAAQYVGRVPLMELWDGDVLACKLVPVTDGEQWRFWDPVARSFHDSITGTPLEGGDL